MSSRSTILAELMAREGSVDESLGSLVEAASLSRADGLVVTAAQAREPQVLRRVCEDAGRLRLSTYVEWPASSSMTPPSGAGIAGYLVRLTTTTDVTWLRQLGQRAPLLLLAGADRLEAVARSLKGLNPGCITLLYAPPEDGQIIDLTPLKHLKTLGYAVGYGDTRANPWLSVCSVVSAGAQVVVKGLTLSRHYWQAADRGALHPVEYRWMVQRIREHETQRCRVREPTALEYEESLVATRPLRAGEVLDADDVGTMPRLRGLTARFRPTVIGKRLLYDCGQDEPVTFGILEPWETPRDHPRRADCSIVIRSKNEARWLRRCLWAIYQQQTQPKEIILVDNESDDDTVGIAESFGCVIETIRDRDFSFGRALNRGIQRASGKWVVSLSAHCIPVHDQWLTAFMQEDDDPQDEDPLKVAAYGRQEPLPETSDFDKRDLWTTFGAQRRLQHGQDFFFHNANSMIRRTAWERIRFDEELHGVEDRDWAKKVLGKGRFIVYAPLASVHHWHGIHQGRDERRAKRVARVIEMIHRRSPIGAAS